MKNKIVYCLAVNWLLVTFAFAGNPSLDDGFMDVEHYESFEINNVYDDAGNFDYKQLLCRRHGLIVRVAYLEAELPKKGADNVHAPLKDKRLQVYDGVWQFGSWEWRNNGKNRVYVIWKSNKLKETWTQYDPTYSEGWHPLDCCCCGCLGFFK